jgi:hypothetical protein
MSPLIVMAAPGRLVRRPDGEPLTGPTAVDPSRPFWRRRLADGDVVPAPAKAAGSAKPKPPRRSRSKPQPGPAKAPEPRSSD